jgi:uncharacterized protein YbjQ (UPF0145 family)
MLDLALFLTLLTAGYFVGRTTENRHYKSILLREKASIRLPAVTGNLLPQEDQIAKSFLVSGSCVISIDYFKRILAGLRNIMGGRVTAYETLIDRARREAILRMKYEAIGSHIIVNTRVETASVFSSTNQNGIGSVEVFAYGTAIKLKRTF